MKVSFRSAQNIRSRIDNTYYIQSELRHRRSLIDKINIISSQIASSTFHPCLTYLIAKSLRFQIEWPAITLAWEVTFRSMMPIQLLPIPPSRSSNWCFNKETELHQCKLIVHSIIFSKSLPQEPHNHLSERAAYPFLIAVNKLRDLKLAKGSLHHKTNHESL